MITEILDAVDPQVADLAGFSAVWALKETVDVHHKICMIRQVEAIPVAVRPPTEARPPEDHLQEVSPLEDRPQGMSGTEEVTPQVSDARLTWILEEDHQ